ncbi:ankyrin repeat-containing domain protein [Trichoderma sp. SZMC 28012]
MSLGFEVDFLAVIGLVNQIRKSFVGAPEQFRAISDDVRGFSIVLQDIEANYTELSPEQSQEYQSIVTSCKNLLVQLKKTLDNYAGVAEAGKTGKKAAIKRVWKRLKWEPDDIRDIRSQISVKIATLKSLNDQVTNRNIVKLIRHHADAEREATMKWISDINYVAQQNDLFLRCQIGSRRWLFESEIYLEWCKQKGSLLFCPGNAGTGKTFTTAMVIESLRLANDAETLTTYMYCSYQNHTQTIEKLLCSLLRVALEEADHEADGSVSNCKQLRLSNKTISRHHCLQLLQDLFSRFTRVNLIVDAVDELTNEVRRPLIYDLLKLHEHTNVSLFVTSRGIPEIQHLFRGCEKYTSLEVRSSDEDIRNFLKDNIFQLPKFVDRSPELQDEVIESVTNASAGMFLLADLYLKSLANIISVGSLRTRLSNLATGSNAYDALYEDSMLRIGFQGPELERIAVQMLLVLTCARRPLSPKELSHALSIGESNEAFDEDMIPDMDDLVAACTGLAVLDDSSNIVHLVHKSAAEYFERTRFRWFPRANEKMAFMCLRYLQIAEKKPEEIRGEQAPFFHYAKANWCYHSMESEKEATNDVMTGDASETESASDSGPLQNGLTVTQLSIQQMTKEVVDVESSIVEACHAGHQAWVEQLLLVRNYDINTHGIRQETFISDDGVLIASALPSRSFRDNILLTIAAARGDYGMTQMLLAQGADPNIFNAMGQTPLLIATANGFDHLVSLLLDQKLIKPDLTCQHSGTLSTAFLTSIGLEQEGCFRILLERSNRKARDSQKRGAMWLAASSGYTGIISELLKWSDVEIDYADTDCGSPLAAAVKGSHEDAALLLMPYSKFWSCSHCGVTPIHYAVYNRLHNLLERLLKHDASAVDSELHTHPHEGLHFLVDYNQYGIERVKTPLTTAISLQDVQAIRLLLPYANVNQGVNTWRPLHGAVEWGNTEIFELLLKQANIEPDPVDDHGRTPFLIAAEHGNYDFMKALIQKGDIQLHIRNEHGKTPYYLMAECGNFDMMNRLIEKRDSQLDVTNEDGNTPGLLMAECRNCDLIKSGDIQSDGWDALGYVVNHYINSHFPNVHIDCYHILTSILDIDVNRKDLDGSSFLHRACSVRPKISVKRKRGIQIFETELLETNSGHLVTELLKRPGIDVNLLDDEGNTPLLLAVKSHQRDVIRLLLEREDTNVLAQDVHGNDALSLASIYQPMFKQLFSKNASSMRAKIRPLTGQVPTHYRLDHWPEVLDAEFKGYAESIFSMLFHDKRIDLTTLFKEQHKDLTTLFHDKHTDLYHYEDDCDGIIGRVIVGGTKNMLQAVLEVTELASELKILFPDDRSLISYALEDNEDDEAVELLIALCSSAVLQKADAKGRTPLSFAVQRDTSKATQLLLKAGVNINATDQFGKTPLSYAAEKGRSNTAHLLLAADETLLNIPDCKGLTPLMHASYEMNIPVISIFLRKSNVDLLTLDGKGHSFLCYLMKPRYSDIYGYEPEKVTELDGVIPRIHHLLQPHVSAIKSYIHSPFLCPLEKHEKWYHGPRCKLDMHKERREKIVGLMNNLQRYNILSDFFHPGLDFSRCATIAGLLEILGEEKHGVEYDALDRQSLCIRVLRLYVKKDT